jgi:hypothetical protein
VILLWKRFTKTLTVLWSLSVNFEQISGFIAILLFCQSMPTRLGFETSRLVVLHYLWSLCKIRRALTSDSPIGTEWRRAERFGLLSMASLNTAIISRIRTVFTLPPFFFGDRGSTVVKALLQIRRSLVRSQMV